MSNIETIVEIENAQRCCACYLFFHPLDDELFLFLFPSFIVQMIRLFGFTRFVLLTTVNSVDRVIGPESGTGIMR